MIPVHHHWTFCIYACIFAIMWKPTCSENLQTVRENICWYESHGISQCNSVANNKNISKQTCTITFGQRVKTASMNSSITARYSSPSRRFFCNPKSLEERTRLFHSLYSHFSCDYNKLNNLAQNLSQAKGTRRSNQQEILKSLLKNTTNTFIKIKAIKFP